MSRRSRQTPRRRDDASLGTDVASSTANADEGPPDQEADTHPGDPTRTRSGRFKKDFVHNDTGRRGKRPKPLADDLAAMLRSIAKEPIAGEHPITGKTLTVFEGLTRALVQAGYKQPRIGLAVLELMLRSGAVRLKPAEEENEAGDFDAATLEAYFDRIRRREQARAASVNHQGAESDL